MSNNIVITHSLILMILTQYVFSQSAPPFSWVRNITSVGNNQMNTAKYSPDGKYIVSISLNDGLTVFNTSDYSRTSNNNSLFSSGQIAYGLSLTPDGTRVVFSHYQNTASNTYVMNIPSLSLNQTSQSTSLITMQEFDVNHNSTKYIRCGYPGFEIVSLINNTVIVSNPLTNSNTHACKFSVENNYAVTALNGNSFYVYNNTNHNIFQYKSSGYISCLMWNSKGSSLAFVVAGSGGGVYIWDLQTKIIQKIYYNVVDEWYMALDWSPDDTMLAFSVRYYKTIVLNMTSPMKNVIFDVSMPGYCWEVDFSPNSQYLL